MISIRYWKPITLQNSILENKMKRILLVEDEMSLQEAIRLNLELEHYDVVVAGNGKRALEVFDKERFDLVILDVMIPEIDGFDVCKTIRVKDTETPILFLTAKDSSADRVEGLKLGADDYLVKPFNLEELLLRVKILVGRKEKHSSSIQNIISFGDNEVNFNTYRTSNYKGETRHLTDTEVKILKILIKKADQVVSRKELLETVWGYDVYPSTRTIDNFILNFRKYYEKELKKPAFFHSIRGVGYKFTYSGNH